MLDGVLLSELGADEVNKPTGKNAAIAASVSFTPGRAVDAGAEKSATTSAAEKHPVVVVFCCGGGGGLMAAKELVTVKGATDHDWRALECVRENGLEQGVRLMSGTRGERLQKAAKRLEPERSDGRCIQKARSAGARWSNNLGNENREGLH